MTDEDGKRQLGADHWAWCIERASLEHLEGLRSGAWHASHLENFAAYNAALRHRQQQERNAYEAQVANKRERTS